MATLVEALSAAPRINHENYYSEPTQGPQSYFNLGDFKLEMGEILPRARLAYRTLGTLNKARDNAILFPHMYSGTSASMEPFVGVGRPLDPRRYFIILPGQFGNGFSSSPSNTPAPFDRARFPKVTIGDDVRAQYRLVTEQFNIDRLQLVLGWSMGAEQTYEWAVRYPKMVLRAAPFGGTAKTTPHNYLFVCLHEEAIRSDPAWDGGDYPDPSAVKAGLYLHSHVFSVMGTCPAFYKQEAWRTFGSTSLEEFMQNFWEAWFLPMDANNLLCMAWKWRHGDVSRLTGGDLQQALREIRAKTYVMPFANDMFLSGRGLRRRAGDDRRQRAARDQQSVGAFRDVVCRSCGPTTDRPEPGGASGDTGVRFRGTAIPPSCSASVAPSVSSVLVYLMQTEHTIPWPTRASSCRGGEAPSELSRLPLAPGP